MTNEQLPITKTANVALALGSNLGDSATILENALEKLAQIPEIKLVARSRWYQTAPVGPPQPDYINGCALLQVQVTPRQLLTILLDIEQESGRVRQQRWQARTLDLDIILFNDLILDSPELQIPHPRMRERAFVLIPLAEIAPQWIDPVTHSAIAQLATKIDPSGVKLLLN